MSRAVCLKLGAVSSPEVLHPGHNFLASWSHPWPSEGAGSPPGYWGHGYTLHCWQHRFVLLRVCAVMRVRASVPG